MERTGSREVAEWSELGSRDMDGKPEGWARGP